MPQGRDGSPATIRTTGRTGALSEVGVGVGGVCMRQGRQMQTFAKYLKRDYPRCCGIEDDPAKR